MYIRKYFVGLLVALLEIVLGSQIYLQLIDTPNQISLESVHPALLFVYLFLKFGAVIHSCHFIDEFIPKHKHVKIQPAK